MNWGLSLNILDWIYRIYRFLSCDFYINLNSTSAARCVSIRLYQFSLDPQMTEMVMVDPSTFGAPCRQVQTV